VALYASSASALALNFSDYPYGNWSDAQVITNDSADTPCSACIDWAGNLYVVYSDTSFALKVRKLTFSGGQWGIGAASTVVNSDMSYRPVIIKDGDGKLWCLFDHFRLSYDARHYVRAKSSSDDGQTWGSGPSDLGTSLSSAWIEPVYVSACCRGGSLFAVYCADDSRLMLRICDLSELTWRPESEILDITGIEDQFDMAISDDGRLGILLTPSSGGVFYKEFDGLTWGGLIAIDTVDARSPQIHFSGGSPQLFYAELAGSGYYLPRYAAKIGQVFVVKDISPAFGAFDRILLFAVNESPQYQDKTSAATNVTTGDVIHSGSQGLLDSAGDCVCFGKASKFHRAAIVLSTAGMGGVVIWEYWDGVTWVEFAPQSGTFAFDSNDQLILFWQDLASVPSGWQIGLVNGINAFWVRARVTLGFTTNPVGTMIIVGTKLADMALVRPASIENGGVIS
jgi:hypothetical protein